MNLWTFVLLGFLAHSCSSVTSNNCAVDTQKLQEEIHDALSRHLLRKNGFSFQVNIANGGVINTTVTGLGGLAIKVEIGGDGNYNFNCQGPLILNSKQFTKLVINVNLNGIVSLAFSAGAFKLEQLGNILVSTSVAERPTLTSEGGLLGGVLGGLLGGLLGGVVGTVLEIIDSLLSLLIPSCEHALTQELHSILGGALGEVGGLLQSVLASLGTGSSAGGGILALLPSNYSIVGPNGVSKCNCEPGQNSQQGHP